MSKLLIISHTEHYIDDSGQIVGWGSTVSEINYLSKEFEDIYHIAALLKDKAPSSALPYARKNIHFVPIKRTGGKRFSDKLAVLWYAPATLLKVRSYLKKVDVFQFRAPTGMGVYLIPFLSLFIRKKGWFKYAGNWNQKNPPTGYALQRWFLKHQKRIVTINGRWENQPVQCLSFENPCLTEENRTKGLQAIDNKVFTPPFTFCFAGRLEDEKGARRIIEAFVQMERKELVKTVEMIGDGDRDSYEKLADKAGVSFVFHGSMKREKAFEIFQRSHFFLLPSTASEGFPKVIAEAINFGCIPIVSEISSIGQYIKESDNGLIVNPVTSERLSEKIGEGIQLKKEQLKKMQYNNHKIGEKFTYKNYFERIIKEIIA